MRNRKIAIALAVLVIVSASGAAPWLVRPATPGLTVTAASMAASAVPPQGVWTLANRLPAVYDTAPIAYDSAADRLVYFGSGTAPLFGRSTLFGDTWTYNVTANLWTNTSSSGAPRFRTGYQIVYDPVTDQVWMYGGNLVFPFSGGANLPPTNELWSFALGTGTWTNATPAVSPAITFWFSLALDSTRNRLVLFGGRVAYEAWSNDTWIYDISARQWSNVTPMVSPPARDGGVMAYDPITDRVLLFGGENGTGILADTWTYDPGANRWSLMHPPTAPPSTPFAPAVFDPQAQRILVLGAGGATWAYNGAAASWTSYPVPPWVAVSDAPYYGATAAYDSQARMTILLQPDQYGGSTTLGYASANDTWRRLAPSDMPGVTLGPSMAYDVAADRTILFGGSYEHPLACNNLTWAYDLSHNQWTLRQPATAPSCGSIVYDSAADRVVLYDGASSSTWVYDYAQDTWTQMHPTTTPPVAYDVGYAMTYNAAADRVILFGGIHRGGGFSRETWAYDLTADSWENRTRSGGPPPLYFPAMAYDALTGRDVLFGGMPFNGLGASNETWIYDYASNGWTNATVVGSPPPRSDAGFVYDTHADRFILFGGSGAILTRGDTWTYDANANRWTQMAPATGPSARSGFGMAYDSRGDRVVLLGGNVGGSADGTWWYAYPSGYVFPTGPGGGVDPVIVAAAVLVIVPVVAFGVVLLLWARRSARKGGRGKEV